MGRRRVEESAVIDARPADVYAIVADYRNGHPRILPTKYFHDLEVESGGQGAGTVIRFHLRAAGRDRAYRMVISEPEPGRVLVESDTASTAATTFTFTPEDNGQRTQVRIATEWDAKPSLLGVIEQALTGLVLRPIYREELRQLAAVASERQTQTRNA